MGSTRSMGENVWWLLRSRPLTESATFWIVLIIVYLTVSSLAGLRGVGYSERIDESSRSIAFDLNPVLWLPNLFLHTDPAANPVPFMVWWVLLAILVAEVVMVAFRMVRGPSKKTKGLISRTRSPKLDEVSPGESPGHRRQAPVDEGVPGAR